MAAVMVSNGTPTRLPSRSFGVLMPALRWMAMKPWRNARDGNTGIATNGHCLLAKRWTNSELENSATSNSSPAARYLHPRRQPTGGGPWLVDGNEVEIDAVDLDLAGVERLHSVIKPARERKLQIRHLLVSHNPLCPDDSL